MLFFILANNLQELFKVFYMAKKKADQEESEENGIIEESDFNLSDEDCQDIADYATKNRIIATLWLRVVEPYVDALVNSKKPFVKPPEAMKALETIAKLKGFDKAEADNLPNEIELKL